MSDPVIAKSAEDFRDLHIDLLPTGAVWPTDPDATLPRFLSGQSEEWARFHGLAVHYLEREAFPGTAVDLLPEWERVAGLPDPCIAEPQTISERQAAVVSKFAEKGSLKRSYYIEKAAEMGHRISITEFRPFTCGLSKCGGDDPIGSEDVRWYWRVTLLDRRVTWFRAGSGECGKDPLASFSIAQDLDCFIRRAKPAHTDVTLIVAV